MATLKAITVSRWPHNTPPYRLQTEAQKIQDNFNTLNGFAGPATQYAADTATAGFTATGAEVAGANNVFLDLTGSMGADAAIQLPTAAAIVAAIPNAFVGQTYRLRIANKSAVNHVWTVTTNTGLTLSGTMTIAQNTWREFMVTLTSLTAVAVQSLGQVIVA